MDRNVRVALYIGVGLLGWFASGLLTTEQADPASAASNAAQPARALVEVADFSVQPYRPLVVLRAVTEANRAVELRSEVAGKLLARPQPKGAQVEPGAVVCQLDRQSRPEQLNEARAALRVAELDYQGARRLERAGIESESAIAKAAAARETAVAAVRRAELALANSDVVAPFAGVVEDIAVYRGDLLQVGQVCALLLELNPLRVVAYVTESERAKLTLGAPVVAELVTGQQLSGEIIFVASSDQGATHSYRVEALMDNPALLAAGISAQLQLATAPLQASYIPAHLMVLDRSGALVVRAVDSDSRVVEYPVSPVGEDKRGVWVTGLPEQVRLITVGQNYVAAGDPVAAQLAASDSESPRP